VEVDAFLRGEVVIEEKVDGANIGISVSQENKLIVQNRGAFIERPAPVQFQPLWSWLNARSDELISALGRNFILFGEWCYAVHSVRYDRLPDWFIGFDIYDRAANRFCSSDRRDDILSSLHLFAVPRIARGHYSMSQLVRILEEGRSSFGDAKLEGLYLRRESKGWLEQRVKIVRAEFTQSIEAHWSSRPLSKNAIAQ
jgi:ATP-dependent RNA circularization protein (DNA/RNA ligase family)